MNIRIFLLILIAIFKLSACRVVIDVVSTANNTNYRLSIKPSISFSQKRLPAKNTIVVDETITYQTIIGWGGAMTEAASLVWSLLLPELQQEVIDAYFSPRGLSYSLCRITMGSPDFALNKYNCDNHTGDYELKHFNIDRDRRYVLPFVKRAQETNKNLEFFFSPWSPPGWMKKNGDMNKSIFPDGLINSTEIYKSWALYFSKFITAYNKEGVKFWGFTVQNEPEANVPYPSCAFTAQSQNDFIKKYLGPRISLDHPNVKMIIYDSNRDRMTPWVDAILSDTETSKYISGVAFHWYSFDDDHHYVRKLQEKFPTKFFYNSEACHLEGVKINDYSRGQDYGLDIIKGLLNFSSGWVDWNIILDPNGGPCHSYLRVDAPIIADYVKQQLYYQVMYFYLGHFTKFVPAGSVRIKVETNPRDGVYVVAFKRVIDGAVVLIVLNSSDVVFDFQIKDMDITEVAPASVPPSGITTFVWKK